LFEALLNGTHEYAEEFQRNYRKQLLLNITSGRGVCGSNFEALNIVLAEKTLEKAMGKVSDSSKRIGPGSSQESCANRTSC